MVKQDSTNHLYPLAHTPSFLYVRRPNIFYTVTRKQIFMKQDVNNPIKYSVTSCRTLPLMRCCERGKG